MIPLSEKYVFCSLINICVASLIVFPIIGQNLVRNSFTAPPGPAVFPALELSCVSFSSSVVIGLSASNFSSSVSFFASTSGWSFMSPRKVLIFLFACLGLYLKISCFLSLNFWYILPVLVRFALAHFIRCDI